MSNRKQEVCRDFQRGSCRFGARCKFLHQIPHSNQRTAFDSGTRRQGGGNYFAALSENNASARQQSAHPPANEHRCSDIRLCKERIQEDLDNEYPAFWRLTSYAHWKYLPNDICGDISFEELRSQAYESAKHGSSFSDVVQKERAMFTAKSSEFEALKKNQYRGPATQSPSMLPQGAFETASFPSSFQFPTKTLFGKAIPNNPMTPPQLSGQILNPFGSSAIGDGQNLQASGGFSGGFGKGPIPTFGGAPVFPQQSNTTLYSPFTAALQSSQFSSGIHNSVGTGNISFGNGGASIFPSFDGFSSSMTNIMPNISSESKMQPLFGGHTTSNSSLFSLEPPKEMTGVENPESAAMTNAMPCKSVSSELLAEAVSDIWLADKWLLGQIPEEEPPVYARR